MLQALPAKVSMPAVHPDASYLITGGTGGLGRSTARWLVKQGARNIILASRSGAAQDNVRELIDDLAKVGATIAVHKCDVADKGQLEALIKGCAETMPPIRGVIHGVMVLRVSISIQVQPGGLTVFFRTLSSRRPHTPTTTLLCGLKSKGHGTSIIAFRRNHSPSLSSSLPFPASRARVVKQPTQPVALSSMLSHIIGPPAAFRPLPLISVSSPMLGMLLRTWTAKRKLPPTPTIKSARRSITPCSRPQFVNSLQDQITARLLPAANWHSRGRERPPGLVATLSGLFWREAQHLPHLQANKPIATVAKSTLGRRLQR